MNQVKGEVHELKEEMNQTKVEIRGLRQDLNEHRANTELHAVRRTRKSS